MDHPIKKDILKSTYALDRWIMENGWEGYDPYDVRGIKLILKLKTNIATDKIIEYILKYFLNAILILIYYNIN